MISCPALKQKEPATLRPTGDIHALLNNGFNRLMAAQDARPPVKLYIKPVGEPPSISEPIVHLIIVTVKASTGEYTSNATKRKYI